MVQEETDHNDDDRQIRDEIVRQTVGSHILDEEEETSREIINCQVRRSNAILTRGESGKNIKHFLLTYFC